MGLNWAFWPISVLSNTAAFFALNMKRLSEPEIFLLNYGGQ